MVCGYPDYLSTTQNLKQDGYFLHSVRRHKVLHKKWDSFRVGIAIFTFYLANLFSVKHNSE